MPLVINSLGMDTHMHTHTHTHTHTHEHIRILTVHKSNFKKPTVYWSKDGAWLV